MNVAETSAEPSRKKCKATTNAGDPCPTTAGAGSEYCYFHDPALVDARREASSKGGKRVTRLREKVKVIRLATYEALLLLLSEVVADVRGGKLSWREGSAVANLSTVILGTLKAMGEKAVDKPFEEAAPVVNRIRELYGLPPRAEVSGGNGSSH